MSAGVELAATLALVATLLRLSWIDLKTHRLPDIYTLPLVLAGLILSALEGQAALMGSAIGGAVGFAMFAVIGHFFFARTGREGLGLGDAKLFAAAGTWLGWTALPSVLLVAAGSALLFALATQARSKGVAFGPWIALGFVTLWLLPDGMRWF